MGELNITALQFALNKIVDRHEILRTVYSTDDKGGGIQVVIPSVKIQVSEIDLTFLSGEEQHARMMEIAKDEAKKQFNLKCDPMLRVSLVILAKNEYVLLFTMHHIAADGWSNQILKNEFFNLYTAFISNLSNTLPSLPIQYADYAVWQKSSMLAERLDKQLSYWRQQLVDLPLTHNLPTDRARPDKPTFTGRRIETTLPSTATEQLKQLAKSQNATLFIVLYAAFSVWVSRWSNSEDVVIGTVVAGRTNIQLTELIGFFVNTLVLRNDLSGNPSFGTIVQQSKNIALNAYDNQDIPFEKLVDDLQPERVVNQNPLFQIMLVLQNNEESVLQLPGLNVKAMTYDNEFTRFDLCVIVKEHNDHLSICWEYATDIFDSTTIRRMVASFNLLISSSVENPSTTIRQMPIVPVDDKQLQSLQKTNEIDYSIISNVVDFSNYDAMIVDDYLQIVPIGVPGELVFAGRGDIPPELHQSQLISANLVIGNDNVQKWYYRTGDLARYSNDGTVQVVGRIKDFVCINGIQINLREIIDHLTTNNFVTDAKVHLSKEKPNKLIAYVKPPEYPDNKTVYVQSLAQWLKRYLPPYMVPSGYAVVKTLPQISDKQKVEISEHIIWLEETIYLPPATKEENKLAKVWQELLQVDRVSLNDNFFILGGNSLTLIRLEFAIQEQFSQNVTVKELFEHAEFANQAQLLADNMQTQILPPIVPVKHDDCTDGYYPLTYAQQRLWFESVAGNSEGYNLPVMYKLSGAVDSKRLAYAFSKLVERHKILQSRYISVQGIGKQYLQADSQWTLQVMDVSDQCDPFDTVKKCIDQKINQAFDLSNGPVFEALLYKLSDDSYVLLLNMHHIVSDGWSMQILSNEIQHFYDSQKDPQNTQPLDPLPIQYPDYACWQQSADVQETLTESLLYWKNELRFVDELPLLRSDFNRRIAAYYPVSSVVFRLDRDLTDRIKQLAFDCRMSEFMVLLASYSLLIANHNGQERVVIGTDVAGREKAETQSLIGLFVNQLAIASEAKSQMTISEYLEQVRERVLAAYQHQQVPIDNVISELSLDRSKTQFPLFQTKLVFQNFDKKAPPTFKGVDVEVLPLELKKSKIDLMLTIGEKDNVWQGAWEFNSDLFKSETINLLDADFKQILKQIPDNTQKKLLDVYNDIEQQRIKSLPKFNIKPLNRKPIRR